MNAPRLTIAQTLFPIIPFVVVIIAPSLVFLNLSTYVQNRPTRATTRYADGRTVNESVQKDVTMAELRWSLGPFELSSSTTTATVFKYEWNCRTIGQAGNVCLLRTRSWVAVCIFPIALIAWIVIGRFYHWHSRATLQTSQFYPPARTVGTFLGILCALVIGFAFMKPLWPPGVSELIRWLQFSVAGVIPFLAIVIVTPVAEEMVFRSGVCRLLVERYGAVAGIFLQALLFGSVHLATPLHMAVGFTGGIVLGMVYIYSRSLIASIFLHAAANGILAVACLTLA